MSLQKRIFYRQFGWNLPLQLGELLSYKVVNCWLSENGSRDVSNLLYSYLVSWAVRAKTYFSC